MTTLALDQRASKPQTLRTFSSIVGFYLAFRLVAVVISVRLLDVDPQIGVVASLGDELRDVGISGLSLVWSRFAQVFLVLSACEFPLVVGIPAFFRLQSFMDEQCIVIGGNRVLVCRWHATLLP